MMGSKYLIRPSDGGQGNWIAIIIGKWRYGKVRHGETCSPVQISDIIRNQSCIRAIANPLCYCPIDEAPIVILSTIVQLLRGRVRGVRTVWAGYYLSGSPSQLSNFRAPAGRLASPTSANLEIENLHGAVRSSKTQLQSQQQTAPYNSLAPGQPSISTHLQSASLSSRCRGKPANGARSRSSSSARAAKAPWPSSAAAS